MGMRGTSRATGGRAELIGGCGSGVRGTRAAIGETHSLGVGLTWGGTNPFGLPAMQRGLAGTADPCPVPASPSAEGVFGFPTPSGESRNEGLSPEHCRDGGLPGKDQG